MTNQKIFKGSFVSELREKLKTGESLGDYFKKEADYSGMAELESTIKVDPEKLKLRFEGEGESASNDLENAMAIYEAYGGINETQASDPRLWVYLTHVTLRKYVLARWPVNGTHEQVMKDEAAKSSAISQILSHWFASGNDRMLRRNAIARLWWAVHLTQSPATKDPEYFGDLASNEKYRFTRTLLSTQDIYQQVLERGLGRDHRILITVLEFIDEHKDITRDQIRDLMKELNLMLSVKNLSVLGREELRRSIAELGESIMKPEK